MRHIVASEIVTRIQSERLEQLLHAVPTVDTDTDTHEDLSNHQSLETLQSLRREVDILVRQAEDMLRQRETVTEESKQELSLFQGDVKHFDEPVDTLDSNGENLDGSSRDSSSSVSSLHIGEFDVGKAFEKFFLMPKSGEVSTNDRPFVYDNV